MYFHKYKPQMQKMYYEQANHLSNCSSAETAILAILLYRTFKAVYLVKL